MRTKGGAPGLPGRVREEDSAAATPRQIADTPRRPGKEKGSFAETLRPALPTARGISDTFHDEEKCPF